MCLSIRCAHSLRRTRSLKTSETNKAEFYHITAKEGYKTAGRPVLQCRRHDLYFVFESGIPQEGKDLFACYMESDGLATVKNRDVMTSMEMNAMILRDYWVDIVEKQSGDETCQWVKSGEHLSYQVPPKLIRYSRYSGRL